MKFGKRMRGLSAQEWARDYVDYKQFKRHIKLLQSGDDRLETADATAFHELLENEMARVNASYARILDQLTNQELVPLRHSLGNRWVLTTAKARTLLLDAVELSHKVDVFRRFVVLNSLAFVKIAKKFDKVAGTELKGQVIEDLNTQTFYKADALDALCDQTAALIDRIMLCVLPDGNYRLRDCAPTCPICLNTNVKAPVTLSCDHTFCWSCLSKAVEHRFNSCPLCRKEQSIDPRDYEIDGLIMRFKRTYDFVEDGLDRAPLASSSMRQILGEAFEQVNDYIVEVEAQYATLSPRGSNTDSTDQESASESHAVVADFEEKSVKCAVITDDSPSQVEAEPQPEPLPPLSKGDPVEVLYGGHWYPGMVLEHNVDSAVTTYSVLWWVKDNSQRFGQRVPRDQLREPPHYDEDGDGRALYDYAAGVWQTAADWALEPFRRLRSLSSERSAAGSSA
jgi:hypothetical protein